MEHKINLILTNSLKTNAFDDINKFKNAMEEHEKIIGSMIKKRPVKDVLFSNFTGSIKSLGAWGGDFILVTENEDRDTEKYFKKMGYNTVIPWKEMSLVL